jgi:hypothetical protein
MKVRQILAVATIPVLIGTFGFISLNQANAANRFHQIAQMPQPPNQAPDGQRRIMRCPIPRDVAVLRLYVFSTRCLLFTRAETLIFTLVIASLRSS